MEPFKVSVRRIMKSDYAAVAAIWRDVLDIRNATEEHVAGIYEQMALNDGYCTFVADADGTVVGLAAAVRVLAIGHPGGYVKMNGLGVLPEYRQKGIGRQLMNRVERWAVEQGAPYIGLASGIRREDAHEFYERLGYRKTSYWFRKNLQAE